MAVPNIFANATTSIPLSQLDNNFATAITLGNTTLFLGNTTSTVGNLTLTGAAVNGTVGATTRASGAFTTLSANAATTLSTTLGVTGAATLSSTLALTGTLTASSDISITGTTVGAKTLSIYNADTGAGSYVTSYLQTNAGSCNWSFGSTANGGAASFYSSGAGGMYLYTTGAQQMQFGTNGTERMRIDSSGNVLVGCTAVPSASVEGRRIASGSGATTSSSGSSTAAYSHWTFINGNGPVGSIQTSASATSYVTSSDYRLKDNVAPMIGALAKVAALKPVTYKWKSDGSDGQGFIAHELQEVVPDCVTGEKDATWEEEYEVTPAVPAVVDADGVEVTPAVEAVKGTRTVPLYQGVDTSFLVATLVASIQELKAIIDAQATRIAALESN